MEGALVEEQTLRPRLLPTHGRLGQALRFDARPIHVEAHHRYEHAGGTRDLCVNITTALQHALLNPDEPPAPEEYYPGKTILWKAKRAVYGLRNAPRDWQDHFTSELTKSGFRRMKSDGKVCMRDPFLWRVKRRDDYQRFLNKYMFDSDNMEVYYFSISHTSPQAALYLHAHIERSKCIPAASIKSESASNFYALLGVSFSRQKILKALTAETARIFSRHGDITDASVALFDGQGVHLFGEGDGPPLRLPPRNALAWTTASLWGTVLPPARPSRIISSHPFLRFVLVACCFSTAGRPSTSWPARWTMARRCKSS